MKEKTEQFKSKKRNRAKAERREDREGDRRRQIRRNRERWRDNAKKETNTRKYKTCFLITPKNQTQRIEI